MTISFKFVMEKVLKILSSLLIVSLISCSLTPSSKKGTEDNSIKNFNQEVISGETVSLSGSNLFGNTSKTLSYLWSQSLGPKITIATPTASSISFLAPTVNVKDIIVIQLNVTTVDAEGTVLYRITINPKTIPPTPSACGNTANGTKETRKCYTTASVPYGQTCAYMTQERTCNNGSFNPNYPACTNLTCIVSPPLSCGSTPNGSRETRIRYLTSSVPTGQTCKSETQTRTCNNGVLSVWSGTFTFTTCAPQVCTPNQSYGSVSCVSEISHSTNANKTKVCNTTGTSYIYGTCTLSACESGYKIQSNSCVSQTSATAYYVLAGGSGNKSGSDWSNAYADLPSSLKRGAIYYMADGNYAGHVFDDSESGSSVIEVRKAISGDHGTNTGWSSAYGDGTAQFGELRFNRSFYIINGSWRSSWSGTYGIKVLGGRPIYGYYSGTTVAHDFTFKYLDLTSNSRNSENSDDAIYLNTIYGGASNVKIQYSYLHDMGRECIILRETKNILIEYNLLARNANSAVNHSQGISSNFSNDVIIRYNRFEDIEGTGFIVVGLGSGIGADDTNWEIYGNLFYHTSNYGVPPNDEGVSGVVRVINSSVPVNWKIYNNTISNVSGIYSGFRLESGSKNCYAYNNIWYNSVIAQNVGFTGVGSNWYYNSSHSTETNSITGTSNPFVNVGTLDFRLNPSASGVLPINKGLNLGTSYDEDLLGNTRGADGAWDIGAYEY